jgi:hypothetical protein
VVALWAILVPIANAHVLPSDVNCTHTTKVKDTPTQELYILGLIVSLDVWGCKDGAHALLYMTVAANRRIRVLN